jgi:hypothetical protein
VTAWTVVSNVVLAATLVFVAWQARETAHYARITSEGIATSTARNALTHLQLVLKEWLERPELRVYFDEARPWPHDLTTVARLRTLAEMWADCVGVSLDFVALEGFEEHRSAWEAYAKTVVETSIVVYDIVAEHPDWWPLLGEIVKEVTPPCASSKHGVRCSS